MLTHLVKQIEALEYGKVFRLLRQHKIDINLIYDVNPKKFIEHIKKFVDEVSQVDYLNLFINALSEEERGKELKFILPQNEEDLIRQEHETFMREKIGHGILEFKGKINLICETLREELQKRNQ